VNEAIAQWMVFAESMHADESVLVVTWEAFPVLDADRLLLPDTTRWPVWMVDLTSQAIMRREAPEDEQEFLGLIDSFVGNYFHGSKLTMRDLAEQEAARLAGQPPFHVVLRHQATPATWALLGLITVFFAATELAGGSTTMAVMLKAGVNARAFVEAGEWWRLVTANFLHFGYLHFAVNAFSLFAVGPMLERLYGTSKYLAIYVIAGLTGAVASMLFNVGSSAGASGALFGLLGAMLIIGLRHQAAIPDHFRRELRTIALVTLGINMAYGFTAPSIDNYAHMGGLAGGLLLAAMLGPTPRLVGRSPLRRATGLLAVPPALAALALGVGLWHWSSGHAPLAHVEGPTRDYALTAPVDFQFQIGTDRYLKPEGADAHVQVSSRDNDYARPERGGPGLSERTLESYQRELSAELAADYRMAEPSQVVTRGQRRYIQVRLRTPSGATEEAYATASTTKVYFIRTKGLDTQPWIRPTLERALATFQFKAP
jgi:membrane associated rhomboid family serine protease